MIKEHKQFNLQKFLNTDIEKEFNLLARNGIISSPNVIRLDKNLVVKDFFEVNDLEVSNFVGQRFKRTSFSGSNYTTSASDFLIAITSLAIAPTIGLPNPQQARMGKTYIVKDEAGGAGTTTITIRVEGEKSIDGATTSTITTNYGSRSFYTDGANWFNI